MASFTPDPNAPILVQFAPSPGFDEVSLVGPDLQKRSVEAMKNVDWAGFSAKNFYS